ncbi:MAG: serine/threonine protein kinase [Micromonosporaceae bacterium]
MIVSHTSVLLAGRYRLDDRIAAGGVGEVWRAADLVLRRPVAVKLLRTELAEHPEVLARFRAEARYGGSLCHPGIAQVFDYGDAHPPDPPYLVMEFVDGPSLAEVLAGGPMSPARTLAVVGQAAEALDAAHKAGLLHRDIKPGNLLLGPGDKVKITDFGLAHTVGSPPVTQVGVVVGTAAYLAPERTVGEPASPASDLYSLGIVAYECLAGAPPFSGTPLELMTAHLHRSLPTLPLDVPHDVVALIRDVTAKDPAARPASAAEVAARVSGLRDVLAGSGVLPAQSPLPRPGQPRPAEPAAGALPAVGNGPRSAGPQTEDSQLQGSHQQDHQQDLQPQEPQPESTPPQGPRVRTVGARPSLGKTRAAWSLALATAVVMAALAAWLLPGVFGAANARQDRTAPRSAASPPASAAPTSSALEMVQLNRNSLIGEPLSTASRELRQLGLKPRAVWVASPQAPGTVLSVLAGNRVPRGSVVVLTAAQGPAGQRSGGTSTGGTSTGGTGASSGGTSTAGNGSTAKGGNANHGNAGGHGHGNGNGNGNLR